MLGNKVLQQRNLITYGVCFSLLFVLNRDSGIERYLVLDGAYNNCGCGLDIFSALSCHAYIASSSIPRAAYSCRLLTKRA